MNRQTEELAFSLLLAMANFFMKDSEEGALNRAA
jgi:hypothetical protein